MYSYLYSIPYLFVFSIFLFFMFPITQSYKKNEITNGYWNFIAKLILTIVFLFFFGFRGYVYTDWASYAKFYDACPIIFSDNINKFFKESIYAKVGWEKGFILFSIFIKSITPNYFFWQFCFVLIDFVILYYFFKRVVKTNIVLGFLLFFIYGGVNIEFNLLRNSKGIMIFILSIPYLKERKFIKYVLLNLIGGLFHTSSFLFIPLYFYFNHSFKKRTIIFIYFIGLFIFLFRVPFLKVIIEKLLGILHIGRVSDLLEIYSNTSSYGITLTFIQRLIEFFVVFLIGMKFLSYEDNKIFYNAFFMYHYLYFFFYEILVFVDRFPILFVFSYWIIFSKLYEMINKKKKIILILFIMGIGSMTLIKSNSKIICKYDNYITGYVSYSERQAISKKFSQ